MSKTWIADQETQELGNAVAKKAHFPRLADATISFALSDKKPLKNNRINWGSVYKFSDFNKMYHNRPVDFSIVIPMDVWDGILVPAQREALLDLHISRCSVEYVPETVMENGKKKPVKDEFGMQKYTTEIKCDEHGTPKWTVLPLDLTVFIGNVRRYGLWCDDLQALKDTVEQAGDK